MHDSADVLTVLLRFFVRQTAAKRCVKELKAKALSVQSTSSSGEGEAKGPLYPEWSSFNCFCIYAGFGLQDWPIMLVCEKFGQSGVNFSYAPTVDRGPSRL